MRKLIAAGFGVAALIAAAFAAGSAESSTPNASSGSSANGLYAYVVPTTRGPLHVGENVRHYIYVANTNRLTSIGASRATLENAFVVSGVDETIFIDGVQAGPTTTWTPPPNAFFRSFSGRWPSTVTCPPTSDPCNVVGNPAVAPLENVVVFYVGWLHGAEEADGTHVFRFTVHGTLNGTPVDLTVNSPAIRMTR